jgi:hypothetical protein
MDEIKYVLEHGEQFSEQTIRETQALYKLIPNIDK